MVVDDLKDQYDCMIRPFIDLQYKIELLEVLNANFNEREGPAPD